MPPIIMMGDKAFAGKNYKRPVGEEGAPAAVKGLIKVLLDAFCPAKTNRPWKFAELGAMVSQVEEMLS